MQESEKSEDWIWRRNYFFIVPCGKFGWPYLGTAQHKSSATHFYLCVQYFPVSKQWYGCQCLRFLTCAQMLMRAIAHGGGTDTVRETALEVDSGRKIPWRTGDSNPRQYCTWRFSQTLYQLSYSRPTKKLNESGMQKLSRQNPSVVDGTCVAIFWPTAAFKARLYKSSGFCAERILISAPPLEETDSLFG